MKLTAFASALSVIMSFTVTGTVTAIEYAPLTANGRPIRYLLDSNDQGEMVGSVPSMTVGGLDGFERMPDGSSTFWSAPGFLVYPTSINNDGTIVGVNIPVPAALPQGFLRTSSGVESSYNFPDALGTIPFGINNSQIITGFYVTPTGRKGFVRDLVGSLSRSVEFPGATETQLFALSDLGIVGGGAYDADGRVSPFLYDITSESFTPLPKPTAEGNYIVSSVNESGDALVFGMRPAAENYADLSSYVYDASTNAFTQLVYPGALETYGYELRNDGSVIGYYQNPDGSYGGFVATVPEPSSVFGAVSGLALILLPQRRRTFTPSAD
ncbi:MAG: hypothetical protein U0795_22760 [Pirellulales bacterium]